MKTLSFFDPSYMAQHSIEVSSFSHFFTANTKSSLLWLIVRIYVGWEWLSAGWGKLHTDAWVGDSAGSALTGFIQGALHKTAAFCQPLPAACHPDVQDWYATFLQSTVLPNIVLWSHMVAWGEFLVGVALIAGFLVGISAFFGAFMNLNFMLAGSISVNPIFYTLGIGLVLASRVAGHWGLDRFVLPVLRKSIRPRNL